jgi:hypothetical protein
MRTLYIDGTIVDMLINSKKYFTWFKMVDGSTKRVSTFDYDSYRLDKGNIFLQSK